MLIYFYISVSPTLSWLLCVLLQPYDKLLVVLQISTTQHILIACRKTVLMDPTIVNDYQVRIIWIAIIGRRFMSLIQSNINLRFICVFFFLWVAGQLMTLISDGPLNYAGRFASTLSTALASYISFPKLPTYW